MNQSKLANDFLDWVEANGNVTVAEAVRDRDPRAVGVWLDSIDPDTGHVEIGRHYSRTGNPITASFPELAAELYGDLPIDPDTKRNEEG